MAQLEDLVVRLEAALEVVQDIQQQSGPAGGIQDWFH
jgi:hypothetical protein